MSLVSDTSKLLTFLNRWSRDIPKARSLTVSVMALGIISGLANTGLLALMNSALSRRDFSDPHLIYGFLGLCLLLPLSRFVSGVLLLRLAAGAIYHLRLKLTRSIVTVPLRRVEEHGAHRVLSVLTEDIGAVTQALVAFPTLCMQVFIVVSSLAYLGYLSWQILLAFLFFMGVGLLTYQMPTRIAMKHMQANRQFIDSLMKAFRAVTEGGKELRMHRPRRDAFFDRELAEAAGQVRRTSIASNAIFIGANSWGQILFFVLIGLVIFALPRVSGVGQPVLIGYSLVILYMMTPLESIMNTLPTLSRAAVAIHKVEQMGLLLGDAPDEGAAPLLPSPAWSCLEMLGVTHSYQREGEAGSFTLGPIDLSFEPGTLVFLTGGNGSGKTTLAKILTGLYAPEQGEIRIDGQVIDDQHREWYRQHFSIVFSDFFLFDKLLGIEAAGLDDRAREQLVRLKLDHKVTVRDGKLSTLDLSQGQRKRLALLTAYLEDRSIYLFDEWAADQDPFFKEIFYLQLLPHLKAQGKTVIVISHDDRYYSVADRLVKLEYGQVQMDRRSDAAPLVTGPQALSVS
jgi:putative pyoverdin transport system ATP-binding/permease protein